MFNFKLQKVLDYRENLEKKSKEDFAYKLSIFNNEKEELNTLVNKKELIKSVDYTSKLKTTNDLIIYQRYVDYLDRSIEDKKIQVKEAERKLEKSRLELIKSTKDKRIMEILKDSAFEEYLNDENQLEQKKLDDIALSRYTNSLKGGEK
ncbi:flagellar export protein FliJ [Clostridium cylindrosporum]|uniref:Flagellar FliJ protein n=1 Tax=Clostridium cylindrosporum DSM 605 TaxID=1121307 RepID=A0A0J8DBN6_CLOCY|nr:flagellar export protein FliJ [Clostridium cylindrosporum]KMT21703.1 flagellar export protein FliJ [Clostridium cylindrosporum DSM 605]